MYKCYKPMLVHVHNKHCITCCSGKYYTHVWYFPHLWLRKTPHIFPHCPLQHVLRHAHVHVIVVSCFLQCMRYVQHEGGTIPCTVKTMRQLTCTDRPYKANRQISFSARLPILQLYSMYCALAVRRKVPYARRCSYCSIA